jgi:hypothetical protein
MQFKYLISHPCFFEFELLGHVFAIAITRHWQLGWENYISHSGAAKSKTFKSAKLVERFDDVDFMLKIIDDGEKS